MHTQEVAGLKRIGVRTVPFWSVSALILWLAWLNTACQETPSVLTFVSQHADGQLSFHCIHRNKEIISATIDAPAEYIAWSPETWRALIRASDDEVYLVNLAQPQNRICLSCNMDKFLGASFSPSGKLIALKTRHGLYLTENDPFTPTMIALPPEHPAIYELAWSPQEDFIAFIGAKPAIPGTSIFRVASDGTQLSNLFPGPTIAEYFGLRWAPQGDRLAALAGKDGYHVAVMKSDGSEMTYITEWQPTQDTETFDQVVGLWSELSWSPDGHWLIYASASSNNNRDLFIVDLSGEHLTQIDLPGFELGASWAPDGRQIVFESRTVQDKSDIYVVDKDGSSLTNLTLGVGANVYPAWSPDNRQIAFITNRDGNQEIYLINPDGSNLINISNHSTATDMFPAWKSCSGISR